MPAKSPFPESWSTFAIQLGAKRDPRVSWNDLSLPKYEEGKNHAVRLGKLSGNLIDIDLEKHWEHTRLLATLILPETMRFGRPGNPGSHFFYEADKAPDKASQKWTFPLEVNGQWESKPIFELRSSGGYTIVPPSEYWYDTDGNSSLETQKKTTKKEKIQFVNSLPPTKIALDELLSKLELLSQATIVASRWTEHNRDDASLALCGALLKAGWTVERVDQLIGLVMKVWNDRDRNHKKAAITKKKIDLGEQVTSWKKYCELTNLPLTAVRKLFGLKGRPEKLMMPLAEISGITSEHLILPYVPLRTLTILAGESGDGKTFFMLEVIAQLSRGEIFGKRIEPVRSVIFSQEDDPPVIKQRLERCGADGALVQISDYPLTWNKEGYALIEACIDEHEPKLLVFDAANSYVGGATDTYRDNEVVSVLNPLSHLAKTHNLSIVVIAHLNKKSDVHPTQRIMGSAGWYTRTRSCLMTATSWEDGSEHAVIHMKTNLSMKGEAIGYKIFGTMKEGDHGNIEILKKTQLTEDHIGKRIDREDPKTKTETAVDMIKELLKDGAQKSAHVMSVMRAAKISERTTRNALKNLSIKYTQTRADNKGHGFTLMELGEEEM